MSTKTERTKERLKEADRRIYGAMMAFVAVVFAAIPTTDYTIKIPPGGGPFFEFSRWIGFSIDPIYIGPYGVSCTQYFPNWVCVVETINVVPRTEIWGGFSWGTEIGFTIPGFTFAIPIPDFQQMFRDIIDGIFGAIGGIFQDILGDVIAQIANAVEQLLAVPIEIWNSTIVAIFDFLFGTFQMAAVAVLVLLALYIAFKSGIVGDMTTNAVMGLSGGEVLLLVAIGIWIVAPDPIPVIDDVFLAYQMFQILSGDESDIQEGFATLRGA